MPKHIKSANPRSCASKRVDVLPNGMAPLGRSWTAWDREKEIAGDLQGWPKRNLVQRFRASLSFALIAFVAKQLRAAEDAVPQEEPTTHPVPPPCRGGPLFSDRELSGWEETNEESPFIGPLRRIVVRPKPS